MDDINNLAKLLKKTAIAHHEAFMETNGEDEQWPIWYAGYLLNDDYGKKVLSAFTEETLRYELENLKNDLDEGWQIRYAKKLLESL